MVFAYQNPGNPTGFVSDFAGVLSNEERLAIETKLRWLKNQSGIEVAVVTIHDLGGDTIENFSVKLFEEWGVGEQGKDNGLLILAAINDRMVRIEVGYGLEGDITDAQSFWIIQNIIIPAFRVGDYFSGLDRAVDAIIGSVVQGEIIPEVSQNQSFGPSIDWFFLIFFIPIWLASILGRSKSWWMGGIIGGIVGVLIGLIKGFILTGIVWIVLLVPFGLLFDFLVSRSYHRARASGIYPWWIGGRGGGFGGFGGGMSGGGGASGRW